VVHHPEASIHDEVGRLSKGYRYTVIDAPPFMEDITRPVLLGSKLAIVPIGPSSLDIWSSRETIDLIKQTRKFNDKMISKIVVNKRLLEPV